jgi:hypothetical protein
MKTRKIFGYGIAVIFAFALTLALATTACGDGNGDDDPGHTHEYSTAWKSDATQHWHECTANDGAKTDVANHTGDPCSVCSYSWTWTAVEDSTIWEYPYSFEYDGETFASTKAHDINAIAYGNGRFVAVGYSSSGYYPNTTYTGKMAYSANGSNWTAVSNSTFTSDIINAIAYGNNRFVAVGSDGEMAYSTDGVNWTAVEDRTAWSYEYSGNTYYSAIYAIAYGNGKWVAGGSGGRMAYSDDNGVTWKAVADSTVWEHTYSDGSKTTSSIEGIAYGNGRWVAGGYLYGKMAYSADGENWTAVADSKFGTDYSDAINGIAYGGGKFVAVGEGFFYNDGKMAYSADGASWTAVADNTIWQYIDYSDDLQTAGINGIAYGNNRFVAVGYKGKMAYSADGASWTAVVDSTFITTYTFDDEDETFTSTTDINAIAYGNGRFVAVGENGKMAYADW